ncbi:hypothetical protein OROMI_018579 [Orobanche minor]
MLLKIEIQSKIFNKQDANESPALRISQPTTSTTPSKIQLLHPKP